MISKDPVNIVLKIIILGEIKKEKKEKKVPNSETLVSDGGTVVGARKFLFWNYCPPTPTPTVLEGEEIKQVDIIVIVP